MIFGIMDLNQYLEKMNTTTRVTILQTESFPEVESTLRVQYSARMNDIVTTGIEPEVLHHQCYMYRSTKSPRVMIRQMMRLLCCYYETYLLLFE